MKPVILTALAGTDALTAALAALPFGGSTLGGSAGLALACSGMIACGMILRHQRRAAAATECPAAPVVPPVLAPVPRFFPEGGLTGQVVPFGRKLGTLSEARLSRDLVRRAEHVCAAARVRVEEPLA